MASAGVRARPQRQRQQRRPRPFLPPDPRLPEPFLLTPQLAFRLALLGFVALGLFAVLFFRLWALQVLSGPEYLKAALDNQLRTVPLEAPRGPILDRYGRPIVTNMPGTAVQLWPADLPNSWGARLNELRRLARVLDVPVAEMVSDLKRNDGVTPVAVKQGVRAVEISYLLEHQQAFPGVHLADTYLRHYPYQALAAQVLGNVGQITPAQAKDYRAKGYSLTDKVGQSGVEASYDAYLRGKDGQAQLTVDASGRPLGALQPTHPVTPGEALRTTLDVDLQRAAERGIRDGIAAAHASQCTGCWAADGGAIVALDPRDGSILAMASNPTFDPSVFVGRDRRKLQQLLDARIAERDNHPLLNRAIAGLYPPGSTFKPVTALAALQERLITPWDTLPCTGQITIAKQLFKNWDPYVSEQMNLSKALGASCDTFFYQLGYAFYKLPPERGHPLQSWAARFGFGRPSGVDLAGDAGGLLPTPEWRRATYTPKTDPRQWQIDRAWKPGDSIQLAIGQKDLLATPLQLARFYALIANGGRLVRPHVAEDVEQPGDRGAGGVVLHSFAPPPAARIEIDPTYLAAVRDGLLQGTHASYGTSSGVFGNFPYPVAGKTGTAEKMVHVPGYSGMMDQSVWCGYAPADKPTIVVCALIENGGHGSTAAAPAALRVFEEYFHVKAAQTQVKPGD